ncbi:MULTISPECIES: hypothetical protein [Burkholderiaceae]|jgi:hypothetical protein|uniref:Uncharacterized protein n=1 Tax=Caballeronia sordidicola TaxID=196367 RepID=A0A242MIV1_CABSO|nr:MULTISPECIES: hypothetical protein [Burkholderiaceae]MDP9152625.1 hypothetical protein [Pseudomonadota bacterium]AMH43020.1 hypothetical protein AXG89_35090 [Burkholderia sp. PAMC 26561]AMM16014.1 hypothetical protein AX768_17420 [Burkholderia sp. PAMC 28687]OTP70670.1 hypothetical protein PAMC26577_26810 [Caballeronia sordidicola]OTP75481.1 hypothetical protein PAMC26510_13655 [Caballeronia sordidicola]
MIHVTTWLASILIAMLAVFFITIALPNSASDELNRASAAQAIFTGTGASVPSKLGLPNPVRRKAD